MTQKQIETMADSVEEGDPNAPWSYVKFDTSIVRATGLIPCYAVYPAPFTDFVLLSHFLRRWVCIYCRGVL